MQKLPRLGPSVRKRVQFSLNRKSPNKVSASGIDRLEAASTYQRPPTAGHLNITNIRGVTVLGDGNIVNTTFTDVTKLLNELRQSVLSSTAVSDTDKLEVAAGIDTLQSQLQKPNPERGIIRTVWSGIEKIVTAGGFAELAAKATTLLGPLIS